MFWAGQKCLCLISVYVYINVYISFVDAPASDGPFANDPALSGSSTYAVQSHIIIILFLSKPVSCVNAPDSDGLLYKRVKFDYDKKEQKHKPRSIFFFNWLIN